MLKIRLLTAFTFLLFYLVPDSIRAQKDTEFWFVAPEITQSVINLDRPVSFWISTYDAAATVTLSQPANPGFPAQILNLAPNASGRFLFPPLFEFIENSPANQILTKGILIESTSPITVYYEVVGETLANPEIFSLKGRNALGNSFYIPFQNLVRNTTNHLPLPHAAFDIVATEDNTTINITPTRDIVGHAAGVTFSITLDRGQTYSAQAAGQAADDHPTGSRVTSNKPIAITIKDDLLESGELYGGFCRDLMGDQIVPVERLGTRYIVQKGFLFSNEHAFVVGTENGTQVSFDGVAAGTVNAGETLVLPVSAKHFIETTAPVYILQMTGNGCEIGGEIMPALGCNGSQSIRFVRPTNEPFLLFVTTNTGNEGGFILNGSTTAVTAGDFQPVPGSNGEYVAATILMNTGQVPTGQSSIIENTQGIFQMGFLNGQEGATGCRYAFFSDFANQVIIEEEVSFCFGDSVSLFGMSISESGIFETTVSNPQGCDTLFRVSATEFNDLTTQQEISFCEGESVTIAGQVYTESGTVVDTLFSGSGCDSSITYILTQLPRPVFSENISFCVGDSIIINGQTYTESATVTDTIAASVGCDTIVTYTLTALPQINISETVTFCAGASVTIGGQVYTESGEVVETITTANGCDSVITYTLTQLPETGSAETIVFCAGDSVTVGGQVYTESAEIVAVFVNANGCDSTVAYTLTQLPQASSSETITFCAGDSVLINGETYTESGTVTDTLTAVNGCDSIVTYTLTLLPQPAINETITLCPGDSVVLNGQTYTQPGIVTFTLPAASGCDTLVTYNLVSALPAPSVVTINCPTNISLIAEPGTAPLVTNYNLPTAATNCPCPGVSLDLTAGLPSGAAFPNGITQVCYTAKDSCGNSASCCFTVTIREEQPCDVKVNGCIRYELLTITADAGGNRTYRIRVTNNCANKLIYTAIQLPNGVTAMEPAQFATFTSEGGINYEVRNPNFSPFYSIRFKTTNDSISGGESDIFEYTLPAQAVPLFINITSRLATQVFYEAHLNTFACPIGVTPNKGASENRSVEALQRPMLFPNPTDGVLWIDLAEWAGKNPKWRIFNAQGQQVLNSTAAGEERMLQVTLPQTLSNGLYFFEIRAENGEKETLRFMLQRG